MRAKPASFTLVGEGDVQEDGVAPATVDVGGSQGVQVGTGNVQHNWLLRSPRDFAAFAALSPHAAVTRIRQLPHDDAVDLFAQGPAEDLSEKLKALLQADESRAVAILADLHPRKAAELMSPHEDKYPWLADLPNAAEAISQRSVELTWDRDAGAGRLERAAQSFKLTDGYFRQYGQGRIYWSDADVQTCVVRGPIAALYLAAGGTASELGFPINEEDSGESDLETEGSAQAFEGGIVISSSLGTYAISKEVANECRNWLGFPISDAETHNDVTTQHFEAGLVYASDAGTFTVRAVVAERSDGWFPSSGEENVHSATAEGHVQPFKNAAGREMAVYSSGDTGVHRVVGRKLAYYVRLGGPASKLGFPTSAATPFMNGWIQNFQHGRIYDRPPGEPVAVSAETTALVPNRLGWPLSEEKSVGGSADETIQFFEDGVVTGRDRGREVWVRP
jgi:hypothetical protein